MPTEAGTHESVKETVSEETLRRDDSLLFIYKKHIKCKYQSLNNDNDIRYFRLAWLSHDAKYRRFAQSRGQRKSLIIINAKPVTVV